MLSCSAEPPGPVHAPYPAVKPKQRYPLSPAPQVEEQRLAEGKKASAAREGLAEAHAELKKVEKELKALLAGQRELEAQRSTAAAEKQEAVIARAAAQLDVRELQERLKSDGEAQVCLLC